MPSGFGIRASHARVIARGLDAPVPSRSSLLTNFFEDADPLLSFTRVPNENQTRTKSPSAWKQVLLTQAALTGVPTLFYYALRTAGVSLFPLHAVVATLLLISATMMFVETTTAAARRFATPLTPATGFGDRARRWLKRRLGWLGAQLPAPTRNVPRSTLIVAAYLPNEA